MKLLGWYFGHDANVCLMEDGKPVLVVEKERLSRVKHDQGHMMHLLDEILQCAGWEFDDIDAICFNPYQRDTLDGQRVQLDVEGELYVNYENYLKRPWDGCVEDRWSKNHVVLGGKKIPAFAIDHHLAHCALAFFSSPFQEAGVISSDGEGDSRTCALAFGKDSTIEWIEYGFGVDKPGTLLNVGATWADIGHMSFGWERLEGAGKLMGLGAYGKATEELIEGVERHAIYSGCMQPFPASLYGWAPPLDPHTDFAQALAASLQEFTDNALLLGAERLTRRQHVDNLCITGGVAMNCVSNTRLHNSGKFKDTFVPFAPHDGGLALGMCLFAHYHIQGNKRTAPTTLSPFLGMPADGSGLGYDRLEDNPGKDTLVEVVNALKKGKVVGICYGQAEVGPRALGHRSILADPRNPKVREFINEQVKGREWFRPFAPMIEWDDLNGLYDETVTEDYRAPESPYMSYVSDQMDDGEYPGVVHVDGTTRPQTSIEDPWMLKLLRVWKDRTGCPALLNTSLNSHEPLVNTDEQALDLLNRTNLDMLVTSDGRITVKKKRLPRRDAKGKKKKRLLVVDTINTFSKPFVEDLRSKFDIAFVAKSDQSTPALINEADIIWCEWANEAAIQVTRYVASMKGKKPKVVVRLHRYELPSGLAAQVCWDVVTRLVVVSKPYEKRAKDALGVSKKLLHHIPVGVNMDVVGYQDKAKASPKVRKTLIWLGRISPSKGPNLLPLIARALPKYNIVVAGPLQDRDIGAALLHQCPDNVELCGEVAHEALAQLLERGAYLLNTSPLESFGCAVGEGMAAGLMPLIYDWPDAAAIWPKKHIWRDIDELKKLLKQPLKSAEYRRYVTRRYKQSDCISAFSKVISSVARRK